MAANGDGHFEINTETKNYKSQFIDQKQAYTCTFDKCDFSLLCIKFAPLFGFLNTFILARFYYFRSFSFNAHSPLLKLCGGHKIYETSKF